MKTILTDFERRVWAAACALAVIGYVSSANATELLSMRNPLVPFPSGGNDNSVAPSLGPDGRFVVFSSSANDLVPGGNSQRVLNVFLRDRTYKTTSLVSSSLTGNGGGNGHSTLGQASANGRYVVFQSDASDLVSGDANGATDIFLRDRVTGTTRLVSVAADGGFGNDASTDPVITPDGTCVAFVSTASNLVPGDTNGIPDVFVRDLITQTTWLVSVGAVGPANGSSPTMTTPVITPDGRFVAFFSTAEGLSPGTPGNPVGEVYVRDRLAGATTWASADAAAIVLATLGSTNVSSYSPKLSDDGQYVAFRSSSTNSGAAVILLNDLAMGETEWVSTNGFAGLAEFPDSYGPEMTPDGRFVAYVRSEDVTNGYSTVHLWDSQTLADTLISGTGAGVPTNTYSRAPVVTPNGRFVVFLSNATNLVGNAVSGGFHIYRRDLYFGAMQLVDADTNGMGSTDDELAGLSASADGRFVAFSSPDGRLVDLDRNHALDVLVRDMTWGTNELISRRDPTVQEQSGDGYSSLSQSSVSADGRYVAFASLSDDLVPNDTNNAPDVFVRDLQTGSTILVSVGMDGGSAQGGYSAMPVISRNGRYVAFVSSATNLMATVISNASVYLRDQQTGITTLVGLGTNGLPLSDGDCTDPQISDDGRYVTFIAGSSDLYSSYWRDVQQGVTMALPGGYYRGTYSVFLPSMSRNGRYVAYSYKDYALHVQLHVRDMQLGMDVYTNTGTIKSVALSPNGDRVLYKFTPAYNAPDATNLYVDDVASGSNLFSIQSIAPIRNAAEWSADGRCFAFVTTTNFVSEDDGTNKVYLCDLQTGTITLIGASGPSTGSLAALSDAPAMSDDGRFIAYRSSMTNTMPGDANPPPNIFLFDRVTGLTTVLTAAQTGSSPILWASRPAISSSGNTVAFLSLGSGLVSGDLNRVQDAFASLVDTGAARVDTDADGIPDWWMLKYFGHATGQVSDLSRAGDDADGDGVSNLREFLAGTVPTDSTSIFQVQLSAVALTNGTVNSVNLSWPTVPGKNYQVQYKVNLSDPVWMDASGGALVLGNQGSLSLPVTQPNCFYRVVAMQ